MKLNRLLNDQDSDQNPSGPQGQDTARLDKKVAELIEARGIAGMREAISNTAELGAVLGGPRIVDDHVRERMREVLANVRSGRFAQQLKDEADSGYPVLEKARSDAQNRAVERVFNELRKLGGTP